MARMSDIPVTADDRRWWRLREQQTIRDGCLSDSQLAAYRVETARQLAHVAERPAPAWMQAWTAERLAMIDAEIRTRKRLADRGAPAYEPEHWWSDLAERCRERAASELPVIMAASGFVSERLTPRGETWGRCPLHKERSASFHVDTERGIWHCFGCTAGGDAFTWLELTHGLTFADAVRWLAERYGYSTEPPKARPVWEAYS